METNFQGKGRRGNNREVELNQQGAFKPILWQDSLLLVENKEAANPDCPGLNFDFLFTDRDFGQVI